MWEIQARYSDYALNLIQRKSGTEWSEKMRKGIFSDWTSVSDMGELEDVIEKYDTVNKDVKLYQYRIHNVMTDEAIPCEIL